MEIILSEFERALIEALRKEAERINHGKITAEILIHDKKIRAGEIKTLVLKFG